MEQWTGWQWLLFWLDGLLLAVLALWPEPVGATLSRGAEALLGYPDLADDWRRLTQALVRREGATYRQQRLLAVGGVLGGAMVMLFLLPWVPQMALAVGGLLMVAGLLLPKALFRAQVRRARWQGMKDALPGFLDHVALLLKEQGNLAVVLRRYTQDFPDSVLAEELGAVLAMSGMTGLQEALLTLADRYQSHYLGEFARLTPTLTSSPTPSVVVETLLAQLISDMELEESKAIDRKQQASIAAAVFLLLPAMLMILLEPAIWRLIELLQTN